MTPERSERLRQLFAEALGLPVAERTAFLSRNCGSDRELLDEIDSLLSQSSDTATTIQGLRLKESPGAGATSGIGEPTEPAHTEDDQFGPYTIVRLIGEGGMGTVYLVEQTRPIRRQVALKVVKLGMDTRQVIARFESERQALALMEHPHIAQIHDAGTSAKGRPYFVMEYVPGVAITQYCDEHLLDTRERLKMFVTVCEALQHAHQKGVIHRDIKPSNILVFDQDGKVFPKVIDFGIAKATDQRAAEQSAFTQLGSLVGTPEYMSPEQANLTNPNVDTATDVYSLGVLLYELLAGALPFDGTSLRQAGLAELLRIIREEMPPTPSDRITQLGQTAAEVARCRRTNPPRLRRELAGDLNWIVMKALEKDRTRRYASMSEFAADIGRHLGNQPVVAGPPGALYRARKFARRHRISVAAGLLVAASLVAGMISTGWEARVAEGQRSHAEAEADAAREARAAADRSAREARQNEAMARDAERQTRDSLTVQERLTREARARELTAGAALARTTDPALALYLGWRAAQFGRPLPIGLEEVLAGSQRDGASYAVLRFQTAEPTRKRFTNILSYIEAVVADVVWSPDGKSLRSASADGTICLWDVASGQPVRTLQAFLPRGILPGGEMVVAWSPDQRMLVSGGISDLQLWETATGRLLGTLEIFPFQLEKSLAWSPDARTLAAGSPGEKDGTIRIFDVASFELVRTLRGHEGAVNSVAWSPDGKVLASAGDDRTIRLWDPASGRVLQILEGHMDRVNRVAWRPDGRILASVSHDGTLRFWDATDAQSLRTIPTRAVDKIAWSSDGRTLVSTDDGGTIQVWEAATGQTVRTLAGHRDAVSSVAWSPDGTTLASASLDGTIRLWLPSSGQPLRTLRGHQDDAYSVSWSPDGKTVASASADGTIRLWEGTKGQLLRILPDHKTHVYTVTWSPDGRTLASGSFDDTIRLWDVATGQALRILAGHEGAVNSVAWSPNGRMLASGSNDHTIRLWEPATGRLLRILRSREGVVENVAWSPDGQILASVSETGPVRLWEAVTGQLLRSLVGGNVAIVAWRPDGKVVASPDLDGIRMWDVTTGQELRVLQTGAVRLFAWSPDGRTIVSVGRGVDEGMRLWEVSSGQPLRTLSGHPGDIHSLAWSPDGKIFASAGSDRTVRFWPGSVDALLEQVRHDIRLFRPSRADCQRYFGSDSCPFLK